jgi:uncharacterized membrane protein
MHESNHVQDPIMKTTASVQTLKLLMPASLILLAGLLVQAQTWDGGGTNNNWTIANNWNPNGAPLNNGTANINFAGSVRRTPFLDVPQDIFSLTFSNTASSFVLGGSSLTIRSGGLTNSSPAPQQLNLPLIIPAGAPQTWKTSGGYVLYSGPTLSLGAALAIEAPGTMYMNCSISGPGSLTLNDGTLLLGAAYNSYGGSTIINSGRLIVGSDGGLPYPTPVSIGANGNLVVSSGVYVNIGALNGGPGAHVTLNDSSQLGVGDWSDSTFEGTISGPSYEPTNNTPTFAMVGTGVLTFGGSLTNVPVIQIWGGVLRISSSERLHDDASLAMISSGVFDLQSFDETVNVLVLTNYSPDAAIVGTGTLTCNSVTQYSGTISATVVNRETFDFYDGTITGTVTNQGIFNFYSNTVGGLVVNEGTFNYVSGSIAGRVVNRGFFNRNANSDITFGNGLANIGTLAVPAGGVLTFNAEGLDNQSWLTLANSTLTGDGGLTNNNLVIGNGIIGGSAGFVNNGQLTVEGGNLNLDNTGINANFGNIDLTPNGPQLRLSGGPLNNSGTINLNGSSIAGSATLDNGAGGTIVGRGAIFAPFANSAGMVLRDAGTLNIPQNFSSSGTIQLTTGAASLSGGAVNNTGTIQGLGNIGNSLVNEGTVEAIGGTLNLSGTVLNNPNGLLAALSGGKIVISSGLANNAGLISLSSGSFDNNNRPINNTGQISGYGAFRSGGLANNGSVTFSGGLSTINGNVTNQATRRITAAYNPAIFTGIVHNNGIFKVTSTIVQFTGTYIENGVFTSDPATNSFTDLIIGDRGYFIGELGDVFVVSGDLRNGSLQNSQWNTTQAELILRGSPSHSFHLPGADLGSGFAGYSTNFAWNTFRLGSGEALVLQDGNATSGGALYTRGLVLEGGLAQIASITGNGFNIYYDPTAPANAYLGDNTFALAGGGSIIPVTLPPIQITAITPLTNSIIRLTCVGVPNEAHSVLASTNLLNWNVIGSSVAAANGSFTFTDTNTPAFPGRFYRLSISR